MIKCGNKVSAELAMPEGNSFLMAALLLVKNKPEVNRLKITSENGVLSRQIFV